MNKDLHNIDEPFKTAYKQFSEDPSPNVWEKINAGLDKKDAAAYKRRSRRWKQVAIFSLLLLSGFILNQTNILRTSFSHSNKRTLSTVKTDQSKVDGELKEKTIDPKYSLPRESNSSAPKIINSPVAGENNINQNALANSNHSTGSPEITNNRGNTINHIRQEEGGHVQGEVSALQPGSGNSEKNLVKPNAYSLNEIMKLMQHSSVIFHPLRLIIFPIFPKKIKKKMATPWKIKTRGTYQVLFRVTVPVTVSTGIKQLL